jgi:hypothetical protein
MELPEHSALGTTFLVDCSIGSLLHALDNAFIAQEIDVRRNDNPFMIMCRALRQHQLVLLDICIFNQETKYLVSMRRCSGNREQALILAQDIAMAAGLCPPVVKKTIYTYDPDTDDVARYSALLNNPDFKEQLEGVCAAASMDSVLKTQEGKQLAARVADVCLTTTEPLLRLAAMSSAVCLVRKGADTGLFSEAALRLLDSRDPLIRVQAAHLLKMNCKL